MSQRFSQNYPMEHWRKALDIEAGFSAIERYNVAPGKTAQTITAPGHGPAEIVDRTWGYFLSRDSRNKINYLTHARASMIGSLPRFRETIRSNRCLVPMDGFYVWKNSWSGMEVCRVTHQSGAPFAVAGIWETIPANDRNQCEPGLLDKKDTESFAMITTSPNEAVAPYAKQMPAIILPRHYMTWLQETWSIDLLRLLVPGKLSLRGQLVGDRVLDPTYDGDECIAPPNAATTA